MRCNLIPVWFLTDQHLIAEKRELRMIPPLLEKRIKSGKHTTFDIPKHFTLGSGHMKFFLNKMLYLSKRYDILTEEMLRRGFNADPSLTFDMDCAIMLNMDNDWEPKPEDYDIIVTRLRERVMEKLGWYRYCGKPVDEKWVEITYPIPYLTGD